MQEETTLVPSFGTWDADTEIPYTTVFEKVRATKDGKLLSSGGIEVHYETPKKHQFQRNPSPIYPHYESDNYIDATSELHDGKMSIPNEGDVQNKRTTDLQSSSSRRSSLEQIADQIFTESQHAAGYDTPVIVHQSSALKTSWKGNRYVSDRELRASYVSENVHLQPIPSGVQNCLYNGSSLDAYNQGHQGYGGRVPGPAASPRKEHGLPTDSAGSHPLYLAPGIQKQYEPFQTSNRSGEMPPDRVLPKFGDWDALDPSKVEFTVIFDKARNERKGSVNREYTSSNKVTPNMHEDLYKPSYTRRKNGFGFWICCGVPSAS